jgi:hypothetical protein
MNTKNSLPEYIYNSEIFSDVSQLWDRAEIDYPFPVPGRCGVVIHTKGNARIVKIGKAKIINLDFINGRTFQWNSNFSEFDNRFFDVVDIGAREISRRYIHSTLLRIVDRRRSLFENTDIFNEYQAQKISIEVRLQEIKRLFKIQDFETLRKRRYEIAEIQARIEFLLEKIPPKSSLGSP